MKIDLKARFRNKTFWVALASAVLLLVQQLGFTIPFENTTEIINTILVIATMLGIIVDPTTPGIGDALE